MRGGGDQAGRRMFRRATTSGFCVMEIIGTSDNFSCKYLTAPLFLTPLQNKHHEKQLELPNVLHEPKFILHYRVFIYGKIDTKYAYKLY